MFARKFLCALGLSAIAGCAQMAGYNPAHVSRPPVAEADRLDGRVLIHTERSDDNTPYVGKPTSFTGGATTLTIPLGVIAREIATTVFGDLFRGGAAPANSLDGALGYRLVVKPRVTRFSYEYNQLKNLGFAITPTVVLTLEVSVLDADGRAKWTRAYDSGTVEMPAYLISGSPGEEIGKGAHKAITDLMVRAAQDVKEQIEGGAAAGL